MAGLFALPAASAIEGICNAARARNNLPTRRRLTIRLFHVIVNKTDPPRDERTESSLNCASAVVTPCRSAGRGVGEVFQLSCSHMCAMLVLALPALVPGPTTSVSRVGRSRAAVQCSLTDDERKVLIEASSSAPFYSVGETPLTQATASTWNDLRASWPALAERTDEELAEAYAEYLSEPPNLLNVLTKTPLGPFLLLWGVPWADLFSSSS